MTRADKLLLAGLLLAALGSGALLYRPLLFPEQRGALRALVSVRGQVVRSIELPRQGSARFTVPGARGASVLEVAGGRVRMLQAPCPGGICVKQGWIGHAGQSIACVPGEILIRIEGAAPLDAVTR